jgi:hypothetical protein
MTFTTEVFVWLGICITGLVTSVLALRLSHLVLEEAHQLSKDQDVTEGAGHLRRVQVLRVVGWSFMVFLGILVLLQPPPASPVGSVTTVGLLVRWVLIGGVGIAAFETANDYLFARHLWRRRKVEHL